MKKYGKFAALVVVILGALTWLAFTGSTDSKSYYKTISELTKMGDQAQVKRVRVGGDVEDGSIQHVNNAVAFVLTQEKLKLKVVYSGTDPLPDTFRGGAQALADGKMGNDGVFHATQIQAKCASKYEAKPGLKPGQALPNINTNPAKSI
jgi:cytochrome c-type biogenesis protein CcmE